MTELKILPNDPVLASFNILQWVLFYRKIKERESERLLSLVKAFKAMFGIEMNENEIIPLSFVINPDLMKQISETDVHTSDIDIEELSEEEALKLVEEMDKRIHNG
jgi:hypothetical protein